MVNSPAAHGKRWFNSTCQSHDLLEAILAGQIKQGGHSDAVITASECQNQGKGHTDDPMGQPPRGGWWTATMIVTDECPFRNRIAFPVQTVS